MRHLYCMLSYAREDAGGVFSCILDLQKLKAFQGEKELELSMTEFRLLQYFLENKNHVLLKEQILRRKIGGTGIRTIQDMGYLWEEKL